MKSNHGKIDNGMDGSYGSGGSMSNPMYRSICCDGVYVPQTGRNIRRRMERLRRKEMKKLRGTH